MSILHLSNQLYGRPLLISKDGFNICDKVLQRKIAGEDFEGILEQKEPDESQSMVQGISFINVFGPIGKRLSLIDQVCGLTDVDVLRDELDTALTYPDTEIIALIFDSPGGSVTGVPELGDYIKEASKDKKIISIIDGMCCSAAYWLASSTSEIYSTKSSIVGSIGVYTYLLDESRMYRNAGIDPVLIKSGERKGDGLPGMPVDEEMKKSLQKEVDYIYKMFTSHVKSMRSGVEETSFTGESWYSEEALSRGLIDSMINNISDVFNIEPQDL